MANLLDFVNDGGPPPPENPAVLAEIERQRQAWQADVDRTPYGLLQYGGFSPTGGAAVVENNPGTSGYFDVDNLGRIVPKVFSPQQVADQSGATLGELGRSFSPSSFEYGGSNVQFNLPSDDSGGFFRAQDLYGSRLPGVFSQGAEQLSTNNWRLLGMGPGHIMRNGKVIDLNAARTGYGFAAGQAPMSGITGEQPMSHVPRIPFGSAPSQYGYPNAFMGNYGPAFAGWPGQLDPWANTGSRDVT